MLSWHLKRSNNFNLRSGQIISERRYCLTKPSAAPFKWLTAKSLFCSSLQFAVPSNNEIYILGHTLTGPIQGPLCKSTKHSQNFFFWNYKVGGLQFHPGAGWRWVFRIYSFMILKSSYQDLSNEGSKNFLSSLELVF